MKIPIPHKSFFFRLGILFCLCLAIIGSTAGAATLNWDPGLTNSATGGGSGTWNLNSTANWFKSPLDTVWSDATITGSDTASFGGTAGTVTMSTNLSALGLIFTSSGYTINGGGTLTLGIGGINASGLSGGTTTIGDAVSMVSGAQTWSTGNGSTLAVNGAVSRVVGTTLNFSTPSSGAFTSTSLSNAGSTGIIGPWATWGATSGTSYVTISGGNITAYTGATSAATAANVVDTTGNVNYNVAAVGAFGASANFNTIRYTGAAGSITGNFTANGIMNIGSGLLTLSGNPTIGANKELVLTGSNGITLSGVVANNAGGASALVDANSGTVTLSGSGTYTGGTVINSGTFVSPLTIGANASSVVLNNGATLNLNNTAQQTVSNTVSGNGNFSFVGSNNLLYSGNMSALTGTVTYAPTTNNNMQYLATPVSGVSPSTSASAAYVMSTANGSSSGMLLSVVAGATYNFGSLATSGAASGSGNAVLRNSGSVTGGSTIVEGSLNTSTTWGGVIGGGGGTLALTKVGTGTFTLTNTNSYNGATTISAGTLALSGTGSINGTAGITINGSGAKFVDASTTVSTRPISITLGTLDGTGTVGAVTVANNSGNIVTNGNGGTTSLTIGSLTFSGAATINASLTGTPTTDALVVTGALVANGGGTGEIVINTTGSLVNGTNNIISYGSFGTGSASDFSTGTNTGKTGRQAVTGIVSTGTTIALVVAGDTLVWSGTASSSPNSPSWFTSPTIGASGSASWVLKSGHTPTDYIAGDTVEFDDTANLNGSSVVPSTTVTITGSNVTPASLTFNNNTLAYTLNSNDNHGITGATGIVMNGLGSVTLSESNSYTGVTAINSGTLNLVGGSLAGTAINVAAAGKLNEDSVGTIGGSASLSDTGVVILSGSNSYTGATTVAAGGSLTLDGTLNGTAITTTATNSTLIENSTGSIMGAVGLTLNSGATLGGSNGYTGSTVFASGTAGTLLLTNSNALAGTSTVNFGATSGNTIDIATNGGDTPFNVNTNTGFSATILSDRQTAGAGINHTLNNLVLGGGTLTLSAGSNVTSGTASITISNLSLTAGSTQTTTIAPTNVTVTIVTATNGSTSAHVLDLDGSTTGNLISNPITNPSGSLSLVKTNSSTWTVSGANTYSGSTGILGGTLQVGNGGTTGSLPTGSNITDNATLAFNRSNTVTQNTDFSNNLTGSGGVTQLGSGNLVFTSSNTFTGAALVSAGTMTVSGTGSINSSSGVTINGAGAKFVQTSSISGTIPITLTQGTLDGTGKVGAVAVGANTGGIITNGNGGTTTLTIGSLTFNGIATVNLNTTSASNLSLINVTGALITPNTGLGNITINQAGSLANGQDNLIGYGTGSTINLGDYTIGTFAGLGPRQSISGGLVDTGTSIAINIAGDTIAWSGTASGGGFWLTTTPSSPSGTPSWVTKNGHAATDYYGGDTVEFDDTVNLAGNTVVPSGTATITGTNVTPVSITFNNNSLAYTINSNDGHGITGATSITMNGSGSVTLSESNSFTGATQVNSGTLNLVGGSLAGTPIRIASGASFNEDAASTLTGATSISDSGTAIISGSNNNTGATTIASGGSLTLNGTMNGSAVTVASGGALTESSTGSILGSTGLTDGGSATLSGSNGYTGATAVNGTLALTNDGSINASAITVGGTGTLTEDAASKLGGNTSLAVTGTAALNGNNTNTGTFTVNNTGLLTLNGTINASTTANVITVNSGGTLVENAGGNIAGGAGGTNLLLVSGTAILGSANTYAGNTTIGTGAGPGVLRVAASNALGSGTLNYDGTGNGTTARLEITGNSTISNVISMAARNNTTVGIENISGSNTLSGPLNAFGGGNYYGIQSDSGNLLMSGGISVNGGTRIFTFITNGGSIEESGVIANGAGTVGVSSSGSGIFTLSGANTYTGPTNIGGSSTLQLGNGGATGSLSTSSTISVLSGATFAVNRNNTLTQGTDFANNITGAGGVIQKGSGNTILNVANAYTGPTVINAGSLTLSAAGTAGNAVGGTLASTSVTVNTGGTLILGANNTLGTNSAVALNGGTLNAGGFSDGAHSGNTITNGAGSLTLSGASTLDFGEGSTSSDIVFSGGSASGGYTLNIYDWNGSVYPSGGPDAGTSTQDRLLFASDPNLGALGAGIASINFYSDAGSTFIGNGQEVGFGSGVEIVAIAAVPEPTTILGALALLGLVGCRERKRFTTLLRFKC